MNTTYKLVEIAKENNGIESDYGIAKLIGVSSQKLSHWKTDRSEAKGLELLKLIKAAGLTIDDALKIMSKEAETARPSSSSSAETVYIMLNRVNTKIKGKLLRFAFKCNMHAVCVNLLKAH